MVKKKRYREVNLKRGMDVRNSRRGDYYGGLSRFERAIKKKQKEQYK